MTDIGIENLRVAPAPQDGHGLTRAAMIIALLAFAAMLAELAAGHLQGSVGGPMMLMLIVLVAALFLGLYEAWARKRGPLGWIVNIVVSFVGGLLGAFAYSAIMDALLPYVNLEGSLVATRHPLLYVGFAGMAVCVVMGSRISLGLVNRFR